VRRFVLIVVVSSALALACGGDPDPDERLIPPGDPDHAALEAPEQAGECDEPDDCEESCVHGCTPVVAGPVTCPADPTPRPPRVADASCGCDGELCAWRSESQ
jgi:hypothetical protein